MPGNKYVELSSGRLKERAGQQSSAGAGDANKIVALDTAGRIDPSMMPVGVAADTKTITTSEALSAGDFVNIWDSTGIKVRKADATAEGNETPVGWYGGGNKAGGAGKGTHLSGQWTAAWMWN